MPAERFSLDDLIEESKQSDEHLEVIEREAATGRQLAGLATTIDERRKDGAFDVFLCHNSQDKPAVRELARELGDLGLLAWIDEERLLPGDVVQEKLERAIERAGAVVVCIGPNGLGRWQQVEYHSVYERFIDMSEREPTGGFRSTDRLRVIPVLLPGSTKQQIPTFLRRHLYADLRPTAAAKPREALKNLPAGILRDVDR